MYMIRIIDSETEEPVFSYEAHAPPNVECGDIIRIASMLPPAFPDDMYTITDIRYEFNKNGKGDIRIFVFIIVRKNIVEE